jgi:hypothetical protein
VVLCDTALEQRAQAAVVTLSSPLGHLRMVMVVTSACLLGVATLVRVAMSFGRRA